MVTGYKHRTVGDDVKMMIEGGKHFRNRIRGHGGNVYRPSRGSSLKKK